MHARPQAVRVVLQYFIASKPIHIAVVDEIIENVLIDARFSYTMRQDHIKVEMIVDRRWWSLWNGKHKLFRLSAQEENDTHGRIMVNLTRIHCEYFY